MILGCDFGGSSVKFVEYDSGSIISRSITAHQSPQEFLQKQDLTEYDMVVCTGGRSLHLPDQIGAVNIAKIPEFDALAHIARPRGSVPGLVISVGTGIPFIHVTETGYEHKGGTSLGGGTLFGLSRRLLGITSFDELEELANNGDPTNVNLTVGDIVGDGIGLLPPDASASYFAKPGGSHTDIAVALFHMVAEPLAIMVQLLLTSLSLDTAIFVGRTMNSPTFTRILQSVLSLFQKEMIKPERPEFSTIEAALRLSDRE